MARSTKSRCSLWSSLLRLYCAALKTDELDYQLPPELIAQTPLESRDQARLLVIHRDTGRLEHRVFRDVGDYLDPGDVLVANDSRVIPARLKGRKQESGGAVEVLLIQPETPDTWRALIRPGRRVRPGMVIDFADELQAEVLDSDPADPATRRVRFSLAGDELDRALERLGSTPLPPYIRAPLSDPERYQTVYARPKGSVAAPTAGLHFTPELLQQLQARRVRVGYVTCHIGLHTFRPIQVDDVEQHDIHEEWCLVPAAVADACNEARRNGKRIIAVGTSSVRGLESAWRDGSIQTCQGWTHLYIYPGYIYR
ncbi:MAG TPA: tRNA preQ1(34) S-adenosylmethionine ribosyltransferase-isomerase QueA, partial [Chloroflexota bacterium]|nr:tRNA preQ1(34) S-adenosylmethionine ribosyltransferase-isomerase QueA [Chloroflexota bacterium]